MVGFSLRSGLAGVQRLALMRVELCFDNSVSLVDIERLESRITGFTDADYGNVLRDDPEITFWHEHLLHCNNQNDAPSHGDGVI